MWHICKTKQLKIILSKMLKKKTDLFNPLDPFPMTF